MNFWELSSTYVPPPAPPPAPAIKQKRGRPRKYKPSDMKDSPKKTVPKMVPTDKRAVTEWQLSHSEKLKEFQRAWRRRDAVKALYESNLREKNEQETKDRQTKASTEER